MSGIRDLFFKRLDVVLYLLVLFLFFPNLVDSLLPEAGVQLFHQRIDQVLFRVCCISICWTW